MRLGSQKRLEGNFTSSRCRNMCELQVFSEKGGGMKTKIDLSGLLCETILLGTKAWP